MSDNYWAGMDGLWRPVCLRWDRHKTSIELEKGDDYDYGYPYSQPKQPEGSIMLITYPRNPFKRLLLNWLLK
jgi:hypothetical protein